MSVWSDAVHQDDDVYDDDSPVLSEETLRALQEFRKEQEAMLMSGTESVPENWVGEIVMRRKKQLSQFWYDEATSQALAREVWESTAPGDTICCISCPSLFIALSKTYAPDSAVSPGRDMVLLEFDRRFELTAGEKFVFYDYNHPENIPSNLFGKFSFIAVDPPFLSEECLESVSQAVKKLGTTDCKILLCTGEIMEEKASQLLSVKKCTFSPVHKSKLSNNFATFTNYIPAVLNSI